MPEKLPIIAIARAPSNTETYPKPLLDAINKSSRRKGEQNGHWSEFSQHVSYLQMDAEKDSDYQKISDIVKKKEEEFGEHPNVIFYLSVAPQLMPDIAKKLGGLNLCTDTRQTRIV